MQASASIESKASYRDGKPPQRLQLPIGFYVGIAGAIALIICGAGAVMVGGLLERIDTLEQQNRAYRVELEQSQRNTPPDTTSQTVTLDTHGQQLDEETRAVVEYVTGLILKQRALRGTPNAKQIPETTDAPSVSKSRSANEIPTDKRNG